MTLTLSSHIASGRRHKYPQVWVYRGDVMNELDFPPELHAAHIRHKLLNIPSGKRMLKNVLNNIRYQKNFCIWGQAWISTTFFFFFKMVAGLQEGTWSDWERLTCSTFLSRSLNIALIQVMLCLAFINMWGFTPSRVNIADYKNSLLRIRSFTYRLYRRVRPCSLLPWQFCALWGWFRCSRWSRCNINIHWIKMLYYLADCDKFFWRSSPPGATWHYKSIAWLCPTFEPKIWCCWKTACRNLITPSLWDIMPTNEVKRVIFNLFWYKMSSVKMSKIMTKFKFTFSSPLQF